MGKELVYRIEGVRDWDMASLAERVAYSVVGVLSATVADTGGDVRWEFLRLEVSDEWSAASELTLCQRLSERGLTIRPYMPVTPVEDTKESDATDTVTKEPMPEQESVRPKKEPRRVSMGSAIAAMVLVVVIAVLTTFSLTVSYYNRVANTELDIVDQAQDDLHGELAKLIKVSRLFKSNAYYADDMDSEQIGEALLRAYVVATGDRYAAYYNAEELAAMQDDQNGSMCGIGISIINQAVTYNDYGYLALEVANVYVDSPAEQAGLREGDLIVAVGTEDTAVSVTELGFDHALDQLRGEEGTKAEFLVWRMQNGEILEEQYYSIERKQLTTTSVIGKVCETDAAVGIVRITEFDHTTATQFRTAVDKLKSQGCTSFVLDLRNNPGGLLTSVEDVLTYFLEEGDVMISVRDRNGNTSSNKVLVQDNKVISGSGTLDASCVGIYRDLPMVVLANQYTASAGELFVANMRDYQLGKIVGVKTFGKGSMQTTIPLEDFGFEGAIKMTVALYDPPSGKDNNYDGIGISPDVEVALSEEASSYNFNRLPHDKDNQLQEAIKLLK